MGIIHSCLEILSERIMLISLMNCLFFGAFFVGSLVLQTYSPLLKYPEYKEIKGYSCNGDGLNLFVYVFSNNLFLSSLLLVTLPGVVFFLFPSALLVWKAGLWGFLFAYLPSERFVAALPVIILEGEAYVLGGVAGTILGLSWLKPEWINYEGKWRVECLKRALREAGYIYVLVVFLLLVAAIIETVILCA